MIPYLFLSFILAGFILVIIGAFFDKQSLYLVGFTLWLIGLIGNVAISVSRIEEQEPCRCEVCCKHRNE